MFNLLLINLEFLANTLVFTPREKKTNEIVWNNLKEYDTILTYHDNDYDKDYVFAMVQTLSKDANLSKFAALLSTIITNFPC